MGGRLRRVRLGRLSSVCLALAVCAVVGGCGAQAPLGPEQVRHETAAPRHRDCVGRVDKLIDSRTMPRSDRDYAIGMCEALP